MMSESMVRAVRQELLLDANREMRANAEAGRTLAMLTTEERAHLEHAAAMVAALTQVLEDGDTFTFDWDFLDIVS